MNAYVYCKFYLICYFLFVFKNIKVQKKKKKPAALLLFLLDFHLVFRPGEMRRTQATLLDEEDEEKEGVTGGKLLV